MHYDECHYAQGCNAECQYSECCNAERQYAQCQYAECQYVECRYAECHYTECPGAVKLNDSSQKRRITIKGRSLESRENREK